MAKRKRTEPPEGARLPAETPPAASPSGQVEFNLIEKWMQESVKKEFPHALPPKYSDAPTKRPQDIIRDRDSDRVRGIRPAAPAPQEELQEAFQDEEDGFDPESLTEWSPEQDEGFLEGEGFRESYLGDDEDDEDDDAPQAGYDVFGANDDEDDDEDEDG